MRDFQTHLRIQVGGIKQVGLGPDKGHQRHHQCFSDRVDRRVGDLSKKLLEVAVERLALVRHHRDRRVIAH